MFKKMLVMVTVVALFGCVANANLVFNGDFEAVDDLTDWFHAGGVVEVADNGNLAPGTDCVKIPNGNDLRSVAIAVIAGESYTLTYEYKGSTDKIQSWVRFYAAQDEYRNAIGWIGESYLEGGAQADWTTMTLEVTIPTGANFVDLRFANNGDDVFVDNVSLVPEPITLFTLGAGLIGIVLKRKK